MYYILPIDSFAKEDLNASASLYFDNENALPYIQQSDSFLTYKIDLKGKNHSGLNISANYSGSNGSSNSILFFSAKDFGLTSFKNCKIKANISLSPQVTADIAKVGLYSDGAQFVFSEISYQTGWPEYVIEIGDNPNSIAGLYVQFKSQYSGEFCVIDNFTVIDENNKILSIEGVNDKGDDKIANKTIPIIIIISLAIFIIISVFLLIKKFMTQYR